MWILQGIFLQSERVFACPSLVGSALLGYTVYAEYDIRIRDINGNKMKLDDVRPGDMIDLDYKHKVGKNGERYAKWITVCPQAAPQK